MNGSGVAAGDVADGRVSGYCALVVAKAPVPGAVKTRLSPPATPEQAARLAAASLLDTLDTVLAAPGAVPVVALAGELDDAIHGPEIADALGRCSLVVTQRGGDFARRLVQAHRDTAAHRPDLPVVQIGMDTPQVTTSMLSGVAALLDAAPAVLGPASDGGWWVLGLRRPTDAAALAEVPMSRPDTGELTRRAFTAAGLPPLTAPELCDVDTMADAEAVAVTAPHGRFATALRGVVGGQALGRTAPHR